ncbi:DUF2905 domain-containing protein [Pseudothermotoga thermarum]|uniref:DUF2905 domain-containing protein n=1 Tax=Pseudothermotoga thermarum DSM 5069 TaxID=688269 RepID=F7YY44_9THEM|nr:DUF2905 domain-containing protein [Pseudothermotoga thermarum]AEH50854.1 hypothetical protein Theth_0769 [Pseudothermotoga thermarum DSM 5069]
MPQVGKVLILIGILLVLAGAFIYLWGKILPFGRLPGDIIIKKDKFVFYFPLMTCLIISALLSVVLMIISRLSK